MVLEKISCFIFYELSLKLQLLIAGLVGFLGFLWFFGWKYLVGDSFFSIYPHGDEAQALVGAVLYMQDVWRYPLFDAYHSGINARVNIIYSDSIPVWALLFKIFAKFSQIDIVELSKFYVGGWRVLAFFLQSVSFIFLLRIWGQKGLFITIISAVLVLFTPAWLMRHYSEHLALTGHFIIILAWCLFFMEYFEWKVRQVSYTISQILLALIALSIHPYFLPMVMLVFTFQYVFRINQNVRIWKSALGHFFVLLVIIIIIMFVTGILGSGMSLQETGFGH